MPASPLEATALQITLSDMIGRGTGYGAADNDSIINRDDKI